MVVVGYMGYWFRHLVMHCLFAPFWFICVLLHPLMQADRRACWYWCCARIRLWVSYFMSAPIHNPVIIRVNITTINILLSIFFFVGGCVVFNCFS